MILVVSQVVQRFQELFSQTKYKEAAELAAESPQGILRTPDTVAKFQVYHFVSLFMYFLISDNSQILPYDIDLKGLLFRPSSSGTSMGWFCGMFHVLVPIGIIYEQEEKKRSVIRSSFNFGTGCFVRIEEFDIIFTFNELGKKLAHHILLFIFCRVSLCNLGRRHPYCSTLVLC